MLYDASRHEPLRTLAWDETQVREAIERIVRDTGARFTEDRYWPTHPLDREGEDDPERPETPLYHGACGVFWALHYLQAVGAGALSRSHSAAPGPLLDHNRAWLGASAERERASFMMGDTPIRMMSFGGEPTEEVESALDGLIAGNTDHPARELMWGAPGTLLAALFLRSFAMHGISRTWEAARRYGQLRYSLWTGDLGFAVYLWDCLRAEAQFPTLDVFFAGHPSDTADGAPRRR